MPTQLSLFQYQAWADAALLSAVQAHPASLADQQLFKTLHHMAFVQRYFLSLFRAQPFDMAKETVVPNIFEELVDLLRGTHTDQLTFVSQLSEEDLARTFLLPFLRTHFTFADGLMQMVLHSQNHRGQCLARLRENGSKPPTLDYILWAKDRPAPEWPAS